MLLAGYYAPELLVLTGPAKAICVEGKYANARVLDPAEGCHSSSWQLYKLQITLELRRQLQWLSMCKPPHLYLQARYELRTHGAI